MASILDKYGIKEVADVMFYEMDSTGAPSAPVLYLDTLKVSTLTQSSEVVDARGGKNNVKLLSWDTNKEITLELEDALFSAKSLQIMFGGSIEEKGNQLEVLKTFPSIVLGEASTTSEGSKTYFTFDIKGTKYAILKTQATYFKYVNAAITPVTPADTLTKGQFDFMTCDLLDCTKVVNGLAQSRTDSNGQVQGGLVIDITANFDSNTYYITGDTFARNNQSGEDEFLQFIIPKGKVSAEDVSLTMEADGDPATFSMTVQCLKAADDSMLKFVKYRLGDAVTSGNTVPNKGVASVLDDYNDYSDGENAGYMSGASVADASRNNKKTVADLIADPQ